MKVISTGNIFDLYDDTLKTHDTLPPQTYVVRFSDRRGFYLEKYVEFELKENRVYGVHLAKVEKVLSAFGDFNRNLGVILSGDKGIGKSLFARMLGLESIRRGIPVIVVDTAIPGIASFIESVEQEVMVLFDEFDKTFGEVKAEAGRASPQTNLLSLFDGVSGGKKLFVITCNDMWKLNEYLINRPGRFHYHFRFEYPSPKEIREYLEDKLPEDRWCEIDPVIAFSRKVNLNYDCLRAIAFEITRGESFKTAIGDLNILNLVNQQFDIAVRYNNGVVLKNRGYNLDLFADDDEGEEVSLYDEKGRYLAELVFNPRDVVLDQRTFKMSVPDGCYEVRYCTHESVKERKLSLEASGVETVSITRVGSEKWHYTV